jgi:DNA-binding transcriptional regulator YbjK
VSRRWNGRVGSAGRRPDPVRMRALREVRRRGLVAEVVDRLSDEATHERVAAATGLPLGYLQWAYPTLDDLRAEQGVA